MFLIANMVLIKGMSLAASSKALRPALRQASARFSSTHSSQNLEVFREINKLASEGKWDNINNKPKLFLWGRAKAEAYSTYRKLNKSTDIFDQTAWGMHLKLVWRTVAFLAAVKAGVLLYEFVVPEQNRLHYKYRNQHHGGGHHEEHH